MKQTILVTGGTGFIGSHTTVELQQAGYEVVIIDNLSNSNANVIDGIEKITGIRPAFEQVDCCDLQGLEAVFQKYGYNTDDYLNSVRHYLKDPERFGKVFENVAKRLEGEVDALDKIIDHQNWVASMMGTKRPQLDSILAPFSKESVYVGLARVARDTSRYPAWFRLVAAHEDTLMVSVDSLEAMRARDTVPAPAGKENAIQDKPVRIPREQGHVRPRSPRPGTVATEEVAEEEVVAE